MNVNNRWPSVVMLICSATVILIAGCGGGYDQSAENYHVASSKESESDALGDLQPAEAAVEEIVSIPDEQFALMQSESRGESALRPKQDSPVAKRKIIYNTTIGLVVNDYLEFEMRLPSLVENHGGFISSSDTDRRYNNRQSGSWVIRIPVDTYTDFLKGVRALGFTESRQENAQDVTEEYVDIEARISNKRILEGRIVTMLEERAGKLSDVLEIERELSRVREEIERMEGRIRFLKDRTSFATVTIQCREEKAYQPAEAPTFVSRVGRSWSNSIQSVQMTGANVAVALTAMIPWCVVLGLPLVPVGLAFRRRWRRRPSQN